MDTPRALAAVLVNWNGKSWLPPLLSTLRAQVGVRLDLIVVDNASTDGSLEILRAQSDVRLVENARNEGFAAAANRGIEQARDRYVMLVNPDVRLAPDYCARLVDALEARPDAASATGSLFRAHPPNTIDSVGHVVFRAGWAANRGQGLTPLTGAPGFDEVFGVCAAAAVYRRAALEDVAVSSQVFCERFFAYLEDVDLDWRLRWRGWAAVHVADAHAEHVRSGTGARRSAHVRRHIVKNYPLLLARVYPSEWLRDDLPAIVAMTAMITLQYSVASPSAVLGLLDFVRTLRSTRQERAAIMGTRRLTPAEMRGWLQPFPYRKKIAIGLGKLRRREA